MAKSGAEKNKRGNYLIDKPFQISFILRFLVVILVTVALCFVAFAVYYFQDSLLGINKLNQDIEIIKRGYSTITGFQEGSIIYTYDMGTKTYDDGFGNEIEQEIGIEVYKEIDESGNVKYICFNPLSSADFKKGDEVSNVDPTRLTKKEGQVKKRTKMFFLVIGPLSIMCLAIMIIISIYSLFFSHRMAGPVYRMRVSLDRLLAGDFDFKIKIRKKDFFQNIVDRLELLRQKVVSNELPIAKTSQQPSKEQLTEIKNMVANGSSKEDIIGKIDNLLKK